jgi:hypothetical protein
MVPVEVKLNDGRLSFGCPGPHSGGAFTDSRLVDKDDQSAFSLGFFLRAGQVLRFHERTASSLRSMARFSGFCGLKPIAPSDAPDLRLAKSHAVQPLNDRTNPLECPQFCAEPMLCRALQDGSTNGGQLLFIELGWTTSLCNRAQCIHAASIEKALPCVYRLASHTHRNRNFGASLARKQ